MVKNLAANAGDTRDAGLIPGSGRSPDGGRSNPLQYSCLENPMDRGAWVATVHGVLQARVLEWVAVPTSRESSPSTDQTHVSSISCTGRQVLYHYCHLGSHSWVCMGTQSCLTLCNPSTTVYQAPRSMGFSMQEFWCASPFPSPGDLPNPGIEPTSPASPALAGEH